MHNLSILTTILFLLINSQLFAANAKLNCFEALASLSQNTKKETQIKLRKNSYAYEMFKRYEKLNKKPKILMAAMETHTLNLNGKDVKVYAGGEAVVMRDFMNLFEASYIFPGYKEIPKGKLVKTFTINHNSIDEVVEIRSHIHKDSNSTIYFAHHRIFEERSADRPYNKIPTIGYSTNRKEWEDAYYYGFLNKVIAATYNALDFNVYHAHDYHTALAALLMPKETNVALTIHNGGYHGNFYTLGYGENDGGRMPHPDYPYGIPKGDMVANDYLLEKLLGINFDLYMRYFEKRGDTNLLLGALQYISEENGVGGIPVSTGYAISIKQKVELLRNRDDITLDGINNGIDEKDHARNHINLKQKPRDYKFPPVIKDEIKHYWYNNDLRFGHDLETTEGIKQFHKSKALMKKMLQINSGLEVNPNKPIMGLISRFVEQKNIPIVIKNIEHWISMGGQVVIGGREEADDYSKYVNSLLQETIDKVEAKYPGQVKHYNAFLPYELHTLILSGLDYFLVTSIYEPCGLTDYEAAMMGTVIVARRVDGIGKIKSGHYYVWDDIEDFDGQSRTMGELLNHVMYEYKNDHQGFLQKRIDGIKPDYTWDISFKKYLNNYKASSVFKILKAINHDLISNVIDLNQAKKEASFVISTLKKDARENYIRIIKLKKQPLYIESLILEIN